MCLDRPAPVSLAEPSSTSTPRRPRRFARKRHRQNASSRRKVLEEKEDHEERERERERGSSTPTRTTKAGDEKTPPLLAPFASLPPPPPQIPSFFVLLPVPETPPTHTHTHPPVGCSRSFLSGSRVRPGTLALAARCCHVVCRETAVLSQVVTSWKEGTERAHGADEAANQFGSGRRRKRTEKENRPRLGVVSSSSSRGHAHAKTSLPFFQRSM